MKKVLLMASFVVLAFVACKNNEGNVVATVGDVKITDTMLNERMATLPQDVQNSIAANQVLQKNFIDNIVREQVYFKAAKKAGITSKAEYKAQIKSVKQSMKQQLKDYKKELMGRMFVTDLNSKLQPTEEEIQSYYQEHRATFDAPVEYSVRHILVLKKEDALEALGRIQKGEKFEDVAKAMSKDGSASTGGLLEKIKIGDLVAPFEKTALNLKSNEVSGVVETDFGYHVIKKISSKNLPAMSFEEAKAPIQKILFQEKFVNWYNEMKEKYNVQTNYNF